MIEATVQEKILEDLGRLSTELQLRALELVHSLVVASRLPPGARVEDLAEVTGILDPTAAEEMRRAIEEGCETVHAEAW